MNEVINQALTPAHNMLVKQWCADARSAWWEASKPIDADDPRRDRLAEQFGPQYVDALTPEEAGEVYAHYFTSWPTWPLPAPAWAERTHIFETFPELTVQFDGPAVTVGGIEVGVSRALVVYTDECRVDDDVTYPEGTVVACPAVVDMGSDIEPQPVDQAESLAVAVLSVVHAMSDKLATAGPR